MRTAYLRRIFFKGRSLHAWAGDIWSKAQLQSGIPSWEPLIVMYRSMASALWLPIGFVA